MDHRSLSLVLVLSLAGCTEQPVAAVDAGGTDARVRDDAGLARDTGATDAGPSDAGTIDAAAIDAATVDAFVADAGVDGGSHDAGSHDAGTDAAAVTLPGVLNETDTPAEADYCVLQFPATTSPSAGVPSEPIYGRIYEAGRTDVTSGAAPGITAELGYGPIGTDPRTDARWVFHTATFNVETDGNNNDEYMGTITLMGAGAYAYTYRFSFDGGANVTYCDLDGAGSNAGLTFSPTQLGTITIP